MNDLNFKSCKLCGNRFVANGFLVLNPCTITVHGTRDYSPGYPPTDIKITVCDRCFNEFMRKIS